MNGQSAVAVVITLEAVALAWALGMLLKSLLTGWRDKLLRECACQVVPLQRRLDALEHEDRRLAGRLDKLHARLEQGENGTLATRMDKLSENLERQFEELRRVGEYITGE